MLNNLEPVSNLVDGVNGVANLLSTLFSRKTGLVLFILAIGAIAAKLLFS